MSDKNAKMYKQYLDDIFETSEYAFVGGEVKNILTAAMKSQKDKDLYGPMVIYVSALGQDLGESAFQISTAELIEKVANMTPEEREPFIRSTELRGVIEGFTRTIQNITGDGSDKVIEFLKGERERAKEELDIIMSEGER